nr:hypothetical protein [Tanacetum cinerariifolium]
MKEAHLERIRSGNECSERSNCRDDTDIIPSYDIEPMAEVPNIADYNVFVVEKQHTKQPEFINDTHVMEKNDSNVTSDSSDMSHSGRKKSGAQSYKITRRYIPLEKNRSKKPERQIFPGQKFSPNKTSIVYVKTPPRSGLMWKPMGRIFISDGLRWIPTGKTVRTRLNSNDSLIPLGKGHLTYVRFYPISNGNRDLGKVMEYRKASLASLDLSALHKLHFKMENYEGDSFHKSNPDAAGNKRHNDLRSNRDNLITTCSFSSFKDSNVRDEILDQSKILNSNNQEIPQRHQVYDYNWIKSTPLLQRMMKRGDR